MSEHNEQVLVVQWAKLQSIAYPCLELLYAIPNGAVLASKREAGKLKAEGLNVGCPDLCLPHAEHGYHGLYIEMKFGKNTLSKEQAWWADKLHEEGYLHVACWSGDEAIEAISEYLNIAP